MPMDKSEIPVGNRQEPGKAKPFICDKCGLHEYGYHLAMLVLQSDFYQRPDVKEVVDNFLATHAILEGQRAMKHSPGPWEIYGHVFSPTGERQIVICQKDGWAIASVRRSPNYGNILENNEDPEQFANAMLILLAPELHEGFNSLVRWVELTALPLLRESGNDDEILPIGWNRWKQAFAKVEGKE